jgi:hypothetical protein
VRAPQASGIARWVCRHSSQPVCPFNVKFARELPDDSPLRLREALARKDARQLAREILEIDLETYRTAFRGSPMERAKLPAMKRNAVAATWARPGRPERGGGRPVEPERTAGDAGPAEPPSPDRSAQRPVHELVRQ